MKTGTTNNINSQDNIFICHTPLHILISEKIIELERISSYILIFYYEKDNAKSKYYYSKLAGKAKQSFYIRKNNKPFSALNSFLFLYSKLRNVSSGYNFYIGNIKTIYARFIIFLLKTKSIYTFDDGLGNVGGDGYFYRDIEPNIRARILSLFNFDFTYSKMYSSIKKHYTIYKLPNIMPNPVYISLFNYGSVKDEIKENSHAVILLTGTLFEEGFYKLEPEKILYDKIIKEFNVTHIISHPLQKFKKIENTFVTIIESEKIAEEIIIGMKKSYTKITVIGIYSSALVNLKGMEGLQILNVHCDISIPTDNIKNLLSSFNIETFYLS